MAASPRGRLFLFRSSGSDLADGGPGVPARLNRRGARSSSSTLRANLCAMFIGHFGVAFAAKRLAPRTSLASLVVGAQFLDLLWPVFLLLGLEHVRIVPGSLGGELKNELPHKL
jgi:hypothetical protein